MLTLRTLGSLALEVNGQPVSTPGPQDAALLVYLAYVAPRLIEREQLLEIFWADGARRQDLHSLSQALYRLSSRLHVPLFVGKGRLIGVDHSVVSLDATTFKELARRGSTRAAIELYRGPFLDGLVLQGTREFDGWLDDTRHELAALAEGALTRAIAEAEDGGDWAAAEHYASTLLQWNPAHQPAAATRIGVLLSRGAYPEAARQHARIISELRSSGAEPSAALVDLEHALSSASPHLASLADQTLPLVGRGPEFDRLKAKLTDAQFGRGGALVIVGAAGLGKTRLCEQLLRLAALRGFRRLSTSAAPLTDTLPYHCARGLLASVTPEDVSILRSSTVQLLEHFLPPSVRPQAETAQTDERDRTRLYDAFLEILRSCAALQPLLIVLEDTQWLDHPSSQLLAYVIPKLRDSRTLLVLTGRPEAIAAGVRLSQWLGLELEQLPLTELSSDETQQLVHHFTRATGLKLSNAGVERIARRAGGHPLYALELLRGIVAAGGEDVFSGTLPQGLEQYLYTRLAALSQAALSVADALAVLGGSAAHEAVGKVAGIPVESFADVVDELLLAGVIKDGPAGLVFVHDLVRDAAYARMNTPRRRALHARAARELAGKRGMDAGAVAVHSDLAGDATNAFRYAMAAGQIAAKRFGPVEAEPYWRLARAKAPTESSRRRATVCLTDSLYRTYKNEEALSLYAELERETVKLEERLFFAARQIGIRARIGEFIPDTDTRHVLEEATRVDDANRRLEIYEPLLYAAGTAYRTDLWRNYMDMFVSTAAEAGNGAAKTILLGNLAEVAAFVGAWPEAKQYVEVATAVAVAVGKCDGIVRALSTAGTVAMLEGNLSAALESFARTLEVAREGKLSPLPSFIHANLGILYLEVGRFSEASDVLQAALEGAKQNGSRYDAIMALGNIALAHLEAGSFEPAVGNAREALLLRSDPIGMGGLISALAVLGLVSLECGTREADEYRASLLELFSTASPEGCDVSYAEIFLARMSERDGDLDGARRRIEAAVAAFQGRDFCCRLRLELERARLIGLEDPAAGLGLARAVRAQAADAGAVLLMTRAEERMRELKRATEAGARKGRRPVEQQTDERAAARRARGARAAAAARAKRRNV